MYDYTFSYLLLHKRGCDTVDQVLTLGYVIRKPVSAACCYFLFRENEKFSRENEKLSRENENLSRENEKLSRKNEIFSRENDI